MSSPDALSPFQVRRGLSATLLPPSLAPTVSALNHEAASTQLQREAPCKCLPGPAFSSWLHRGWGLGLWPGLSDHLGRGAWRRALTAQFPISPHAALALPRVPL